MLKKYSDPGILSDIKNPVITVGTFDGVHLGHCSILRRLGQLAEEIDGEPVLLSFEPHPRLALRKDHKNLKLINTPDEKAELLEAAGIKHLVIVSFTPEFSKLNEHDFIRDYLVMKLHVARLIVGYNHRFGFNRQGDFSSLHDLALEYGFLVEEMPRLDVGIIAVSSTEIRLALEKGDLRLANKMLGYSYPLSGTVVEGSKLGHKLGFPTANLHVQYPYKLIPAHGVYAVKVCLDNTIYNGMCNIGIKPTFDGKVEMVEVNIFNFDADIYGKNVKLLFIDRLRDEKKFDSIDKLKQQLNEDRKHALHILQECDENQ